MASSDRRKLLAVKNTPDTRAVIPKGAQGLSGGRKATKDSDGGAVVLHSTQRALQLRNGKGGSFGTGELVAVGRMSGREKLEFLAEDEMEKRKAEKVKALYEASLRSVRAPFNMEVSMKVAQSQMDGYIDFINHLHKQDLCYDIMLHEIQAQCPPKLGPKDPDRMKDASFVAEQFGISIHNAYMLASGWTIVYESLKYMNNMGLTDKLVVAQLKSSAKLRTVYLLTYDLVKKLVMIGQQRLCSIVRNTEHYHIYFMQSSESRDKKQFDTSEIRKMYKSFLDSTIVELCLPGSRFTPQALYACLNAIELESPKELKRCPQAMWDAVGDLAEAVRLLDLMETPLLNSQGDIQIGDEVEQFMEFALWDEAQEPSIQAARNYSSFVNLVFPLTNIEKKATLDKAWDKINKNCEALTGKNIDRLWQLVDVRERIPHFSVIYAPGDIFDEDDGGGKSLVPGRGGRKEPLAIKASGEDIESDGSMPGLLEVSNSEEEDERDSLLAEPSSSDEESDDDDGDEDESDYDSEDEEDLRRMHREAMERVAEFPEILDMAEDGNDKYALERKKNPFLKLLGNLKGRMFSSSSALRTDGKLTTASKIAPPPKKVPTTVKIDDDMPPLESLSIHGGQVAQKFTKATVEEADDESDEPKSDKKKKKKKTKKKKKPVGSATDNLQSPTVETPTSPSPPSLPLDSASAQTVSPPASPMKTKQEPKKLGPASTKAPSIQSTLSGTTAYGSVISLPLPSEKKAESARTYLANAKLNEVKTKVKTRPDQQPDALPAEKEKRPLFGKFGVSKDKSKADAKQKNSANVFGGLKKKTGNLARKLFGTSAQDKKGALKWEQFLQIMRELGFDYDPSTAGSSVRFDPPGQDARSISFHKPHPDPTLHQHMLREYRAKLESYYGWSPDKFQKAMDGLAVSSDSEID